MAKRFQFRLQQVLNFRKQVEEVCVRELAEAKGFLLRHEKLMKAHHEEEEAFLNQFRDLEKLDSFNVDEAVRHWEYQDRLLKRDKNDQKRAVQLSRVVEDKRQSTILASKNRRLLENLRERQHRSYLGEVLQEEQKFLDEISSISFVRRNRAEKAVLGGDFVDSHFSFFENEIGR